MKEFYLAPRGSKYEVQYLLENYDKFRELQRVLGLPKLGWLLVPRIDLVLLTKEYTDQTFALDNGAFQILKLNPNEPLKLTEVQIQRWFAELYSAMRKGEFKWCALPDVPTQGKEYIEKEERLRRVKLTAELHKKFLEKYYTKVEGTCTLRPVLQGFEVDEYLTCLEYHREYIHEYKVDRVFAVGSVVVRKNSSTTKLAGGRARGTVYVLRALLDSVDFPLHFFGLHGKFVHALKDHKNFYSSDSGAGAVVFRWEVRDIKKKLGVEWNDRRKDYLLAHLVQYVRSTRKFRKEYWEVLRSLF